MESKPSNQNHFQGEKRWTWTINSKVQQPLRKSIHQNAMNYFTIVVLSERKLDRWQSLIAPSAWIPILYFWICFHIAHNENKPCIASWLPMINITRKFRHFISRQAINQFFFLDIELHFQGPYDNCHKRYNEIWSLFMVINHLFIVPYCV